MKTTSFTEFRRQASGYFDAVGAGETVRILRYGKPIADVVPVIPEDRIASWKRPALRLYVKGISLSGCKAVLKGRKLASR